MEDAKQVEFFIFRKFKEGKPPNYVADELLKLWAKNQLSVDGKYRAGHFCFLHGFYV